MKFEELEKREE